MSSTFPPPSKSTAKHASVAITLAGAALAAHARFVALEQKEEGVEKTLVQLREDVGKLTERVGRIERDRELWEEMQHVKTDLAVLNDRIETIQERVRRKR